MPSIIPQPLKLTHQDASYTLTAGTGIVAPKEADGVARQLQNALSPSTGFPLNITRRGGPNSITLNLDKGLKLGPEGYTLEVKKTGVEIKASTQQGLFYGVQTLRQLFPSEGFRKAKADAAWTAPCLKIEDSPRFAWRGAHLDVARHFMPKEFVMKYIDLLALHKLNVFHWHLTEDQGWRIEIKKYPKLTSVGAWRNDSMLTYSPATYTGKPHGGFYTQEDIKEIVAYAKDRFVTIVPEIEMPGHAQAAIAAYPELGNVEKPLEVGTIWGVIDNVYNVEDRTIQFQKDVLTEVLALFPSTFIHIGGDEVPKTQWKASASAQARMKALGLKDEHELQSWFIRQIDEFLTSKGRRLIGWDEILEGGLAPGATVMSWRGEDGGIAAAKAGHDVVMAPNSHTYLDYYQSRDHANEPHAIGGFLPLEKVYSYDPVPKSLTPEQAKHILGAQAQIWTEYIHNPKHVEYMAFPRLTALSEVVWSQPANKNFEGFQKRLETHLLRLKALDVNYRPLSGGRKF